MTSTPKKRKLLIVGWDAADWKVITPLMEQGHMPHLARLVERGVMGNLATLQPVLSPMLWTSIATGKRPFKHGILGFSEPTPDGGAVQPVSQLSRTTKALWNILNQEGWRGGVVGWWPSHPVEAIRGAMVSNQYHRAVGPLDQPWPLPPGAVHPERLEEALAEVRLNPNELAPEEVLPFVPRAFEIDQDKDRRLASVMKILAECVTIHNAATWLMQNEEWDYFAVYYDAIDHFCHGFMKYHPPRQDWISERDFELYGGVVNAAYRFHDMMLGTLLSLVDEDTTVLICSDHGFHPDHLRPRQIPREPAGPAVEHRDLGMLVMAGPGIRKDELIHGANLLDITPTLLTLLGLPVGEDMDGKPLLQVFETAPEVKRIPSWDAVPGDDGRHAEAVRQDPLAAKAALDQLVALGYVEAPDGNMEQAVSRAAREMRYNLARSYMNADLYPQAIPLLEELHQAEPEEQRFGTQLAMCYRAEGETARLRELVEQSRAIRADLARKAGEHLEALRETVRERREARKAEKEAAARDSTVGGAAAPITASAQAEAAFAAEAAPTRTGEPPTGDSTVGGAAAPIAASAQAEAAFAAAAAPTGEVPGGESTPRKPLLTKQERANLRLWREQKNMGNYDLDFLMSCVLLDENRPEEALDYLAKAGEAQPNRPGLHIQIGETYLKMRRARDAEAAYRKALEIDPLNFHAHLGLARACHRQRRHEEAARAALETVRLMFHYPLAHFVLGRALFRLRRFKAAERSLSVATDLNPNFVQAHRMLLWLYRFWINDPEAEKRHRDTLARLRRARRQRRKADLAIMQDEFAEAPAGEREAPALEKPDTPVLPAQPVYEDRLPDEKAAREFITVVAGLPRSGTSMLMQMLDAGGLEILTDRKRKADADNPRGYYELEEATQLRKKRDWVRTALNQGVKIVAQLLPYLPLDVPCRVIFIERDLDEVLASQKTMLSRMKREENKFSDRDIQAAYGRQLDMVKRWLARHPNACVLYVRHHDVIHQPAQVADKISRFLDGRLNAEAMARVVDPSLYRQRLAATA